MPLGPCAMPALYCLRPSNLTQALHALPVLTGGHGRSALMATQRVMTIARSTAVWLLVTHLVKQVKGRDATCTDRCRVSLTASTPVPLTHGRPSHGTRCHVGVRAGAR